MQIGPAGSPASLEGAVRHVRTFGPIQRAEVALSGGEGKTVIEIDAPRDRELQAGDIVGLQPRRYRIFAAQDWPSSGTGLNPELTAEIRSRRSPFSHGWYATTADHLGIRIMRAIGRHHRAVGAGRLHGATRQAPEQPTMYLSMANGGATLDPQAAASMISLYRQNNGLGAVAVDPDLMKLAEAQSQAMASRNKLDHDVKGPLAKAPGRVRISRQLAVENVSAGYHTLAEAFSGWRDSPPHKANMLKNGVTKLGIAATYAPNTKYKVFWTLILASSEAR